MSLLLPLLFVISSAQVIGDTPWDIVTTTFPKFLPVPLTASEAMTNGWELFFGCDDSDDAPGNVYWYDEDLTSMPIYNVNGKIAGIIIGIEDPGATQHGRAPWVKYEITSANLTFYGIEGLFQDPEKICNDPSDITTSSIGDRLWFANGSHTSYNKIPLNQSYCALDNQGWDEGGCKDGFFKMGVHYWRYNAVDLDCDESYPIFILYDDDRLHAWGVAMGNTDRLYGNSTRWEHPPGSLLTDFFLPGEAPTCLASQDNQVYNSIHVYMTSSVLNHTTPCVDESITTAPIDCTGDDGDGGYGYKEKVSTMIVSIIFVVLLEMM